METKEVLKEKSYRELFTVIDSLLQLVKTQQSLVEILQEEKKMRDKERFHLIIQQREQNLVDAVRQWEQTKGLGE